MFLAWHIAKRGLCKKTLQETRRRLSMLAWHIAKRELIISSSLM
jgi:hypothetical protein